MALAALELVLFFVIRKRSLAGRTGENFEQVSTDHADYSTASPVPFSEIRKRCALILAGDSTLSPPKFRDLR